MKKGVGKFIFSFYLVIFSYWLRVDFRVLVVGSGKFIFGVIVYKKGEGIRGGVGRVLYRLLRMFSIYIL